MGVIEWGDDVVVYIGWGLLGGVYWVGDGGWGVLGVVMVVVYWVVVLC